MSFGRFGRPAAPPPATLGDADAGLVTGAGASGDAMRYGIAVVAFGVGMIAGGLTTWAALRQDRAR